MTFRITVEYAANMPRGVEVYPHEYAGLSSEEADKMITAHLADMLRLNASRISRIEIRRA